MDSTPVAGNGQPYHLEVWAEKNTMNDILKPICSKHGANLCTALGFQSITAAVRLIGRVEKLLEMNRPVRVFYISDFDPSGDCMPVAVARQVQFWMHQFGVEGDVKLKPLVLTRSQVEHYKLPRKPIKESDGRKGAFEKRHGKGAVELDAMPYTRVPTSRSASPTADLPVDADGNPVPAPLIEVFRSVTEFKSLDNALTDTKRRMLDLGKVSAAMKSKRHLIQRYVGKLQDLLGCNVPHAIHSCCGGGGCDECNGRGYTTGGEIPQPEES